MFCSCYTAAGLLDRGTDQTRFQGTLAAGVMSKSLEHPSCARTPSLTVPVTTVLTI